MKYLFLVLLLIPSLVLAQPTGQGLAKHKTLDSIAAGSLTASYAELLANTSRMVSLEILNETDCDVYISFDASTDHEIVPAGTALTLNFGENNRYSTNAVSAKYVADSCTSGNLYGSGYF